MLYIILYDLKNEYQRRKINKILQGVGHRVQDSVFECYLKQKEYDSLVSSVQEIMIEGGNVRIYPVCKDCRGKSIGIGELFVNPAVDNCVIV